MIAIPAAALAAPMTFLAQSELSAPVGTNTVRSPYAAMRWTSIRRICISRAKVSSIAASAAPRMRMASASARAAIRVASACASAAICTDFAAACAVATTWYASASASV